LKQLGVALHNYESAQRCFPAAGIYPPRSVSQDSYSALARLLPFLEQYALYEQINFRLPAIAQPSVVKQRIATYLCPDEINDHARTTSSPVRYPLDYAAAVGSWFVYDPNTGLGGNGALPMNHYTRIAEIVDGTSHTIGFAEVKAFGTYVLRNGIPNTLGTPPPNDPAAVLAYGGSLKTQAAHTGWTEGQTFQTGMTFVFTPNTQVVVNKGGTQFDVDYISTRDGSSATELSYAAVTSRSYHSGGLVNVLLMDGSARNISNEIDIGVWRALGTTSGGEMATGLIE
jgi:prepilin-type processing-associated H-X9-DG protein